MDILLTDILTGLTRKTWEINKFGIGCLADKPYNSGVLRRTSGRAKSVYRPPWKKALQRVGHTCMSMKEKGTRLLNKHVSVYNKPCTYHLSRHTPV